MKSAQQSVRLIAQSTSGNGTWELTWETRSESSHTHWDNPRFTAQHNKRGVYAPSMHHMKLLAHKTQSCYMISVKPQSYMDACAVAVRVHYMVMM